MPKIYIGSGGVNRDVKKKFIGYAGVNREIKEQHIGFSGANRLVFKPSLWTPGPYNYGNTGYITLNDPASDALPTVCKAGDTRDYVGSGYLRSMIIHNVPVVAGDVITLDIACTNSDVSFIDVTDTVGTVVIGANKARTTYTRTIASNASSYFISIDRNNTPTAGQYGVLTIYSIKKNGVKIL